MSAAADGARESSRPSQCLPCWNDWSVRAGASYDLFGTGKTALKTSVGKFLGQQALGLASNTNPLGGQNDTRQWTDRDGNGTMFDAARQRQFNELGATAQQQVRHAGRRQHAVRSGPAAADQLGRSDLGAARADPAHVGDRRLLPPARSTTSSTRRTRWSIRIADYTPFTIIVPPNANLPDGGGQVDHALQPESDQARRRQQRAAPGPTSNRASTTASSSA